MSEQMRKEFEAWAESKKWCILKTDGVYNNTIVGCAFEAWQASRAAIVVDLSDLCEASYTYFGTCYKSDVEYRLEQAGVSYK
jgi:hypothetical protein